MSVKNSLLVLIALLLSFAPVACGNDSSNSALQATDYSKSEHWLSLPAAVDKDVDVFYLYPTAWISTDHSNPHICAIDEPSMLQQAPLAFERQATAFETVGNIYAPYYRQDNNSPIDRLNVIAGIPTLDAVAAFDYYIKHFNNGRPFILAGHSQGATVLSNLLAGYMKENPGVYKRMVAAYVIGHPVTDEYLAANQHLKFAEGPDDTGVIISWNTEAPDVPPGTNPVLYGMVGLAINPITWTRDETLATAAQSLGSILLNKDGSVVLDGEGNIVREMNYADARVDKTKGVVICSTVDEDELSGAFYRGVYHTFDYPFYYYNIRENAANRTNKFLSNGEGSGDGGSLPVGPLAAGISALLVWWKRRKQKQG